MNVFSSLFVSLHLWILEELGNKGLRWINEVQVDAIGTVIEIACYEPDHYRVGTINVWKDELGFWELAPF